MDTILDMTIVFLSSVCFRLFPTDVACDNFFFLFVSGNYIGISFWQDGSGHRHNGCNFSMIQYNGKFSTACFWTFPGDKIEERIPFALCHARLYLTVSYDD